MVQATWILNLILFLIGWTIPNQILNLANLWMPGEVTRISAEELYAQKVWNQTTVTRYLAFAYASFFLGCILSFWIVQFSHSPEVQILIFPLLLSTFASVPQIISEMKWGISPLPRYRQLPEFDVGEILRSRGKARVGLGIGLLMLGLLVCILSGITLPPPLF